MCSTEISGIGRIEPASNGDDPTAICIDKPIEDDQYLSSIFDAARAVMALDDRLFMALVERNFQQLGLLSEYYTNIFAHGERSVSISHRSAAFWWGSELLNLLNSMYAFLEHYEKQVGHEFGEDSDELESFESARKQAYFDSDSYKFIYELRNYATHRGFPVTHIGVRLAEDGDTRGIEQETEFLLDKNELLGTYSKWKSAKAVLQEFPPRFSPLPHVDSMMRSLRQLFTLVFKFRAQHAWAKLEILEQAIDGIDTSTSWPYVVKVALLDDNERLESSRIPININNIRKLRELGPDPDYSEFYPELHQQPDSSTEALVTADEKRLTRLGVALISEWYDGRGDIRSFCETVDRFARAEGNDIGPVIAGLANTAMIVVQLAGSAIGRNPQSVLALTAEIQKIHED